MLKVKCIQKFRDKHNIIIGYRLIDQSGNTKDVTPQQLKTVMSQGRIEVINLTLTSDNRIIDKSNTNIQNPKKPNSEASSEQLELEIKFMTLGIKKENITEINTDCGHKIYLCKKSKYNYIVYIPDNVTNIGFDNSALLPRSKIKIDGLKTVLEVYGGKNLKTTEALFAGCKFYMIDLGNLDTRNVENMNRMFHGCCSDIINVNKLNTSKVISMREMFSLSEIGFLDLSSFDTSNVIDMRGMFEYCETSGISLYRFNTSKVKNMRSMFADCQVYYLDLRNFDTRNVVDMSRMFESCKAEYLNISNFSTHGVLDAEDIFHDCEAVDDFLRLSDDGFLEELWEHKDIQEMPDKEYWSDEY